ncbi:MAG TPA: hypothetical protein VFE17_11465 [Candidatus Baltobacteraceae bacterium]|jgi:hypothetical protein|nr:hypothetical protein [Candidatus Baltobacteraceae bacterium]
MRFTAEPSRPLDLLVSICSLWIACGFFLDAWAHGHVPVETFFTPYHAVFYSGMLALVVVVLVFWVKRRSFPDAYRYALLGIPIFIFAGIGDMIWHHFFGVEEGIDALLSPTHQLLGLAVFFVSSGPIVSTLAQRFAAQTLRMQLPLIFALAAWLELVHFGTAYAFDPAAGRINAPPSTAVFTPDYLTAIAIGYYKQGMGVLVVLFQSALMAGFALYAATALALRAPALTLIFLLGNFAAAAAFTNDTPLLMTVVVMSAVAGITGDAIVARLHPSDANAAALRTLAMVVPASYFITYFVVTGITAGLWWDWNVVLGAVMWAAVIGFALTLLRVRKSETR